jgi:hypothetical protein
LSIVVFSAISANDTQRPSFTSKFISFKAQNSLLPLVASHFALPQIRFLFQDSLSTNHDHGEGTGADNFNLKSFGYIFDLNHNLLSSGNVNQFIAHFIKD